MKEHKSYEFDSITACVICGGPVGTDNYGNTDVCKHCGWKNSADNEKWDKSLGISYPMLVPLSRAKTQYESGEPFKATFDDFINGLLFYSEMTFVYAGEKYAVILFGDHAAEPYKIKLYRKLWDGTSRMLQIFDSKNEFVAGAAIDGKLLKNIWDEIDDPAFMQCE